MSDMECPIFQAEVTYEAAAEFFVAAKTIEEARIIADQLARTESRDWATDFDWDVSLRAVDNPHPRAVHEYGGVFVQALNGGKGDWVDSVDDVPRVPRPVDPNQMALDLESPPHLETIEMPGGEL